MNHRLPGTTRGLLYGRKLAAQPVRNGLGIVALRPFKTGDTLCEIRGRIVRAETVWQWWPRQRRRAENCFRFDADHYLDPEGEIGAWANHSCRPNAGVFKQRGKLFLRALRPIAAQTEITHDYSTLLGADDIWRMRCNCGERQCRGVVANVLSLPEAVLRRYRRLQCIPGFILEMQ